MSQFINYGIDLGTTNSCIASWDDNDVRIYQNNDLMNVTPSVVRVQKNNRILVGKRAYNAIVDDPDNVTSEFKRWMGQKDKKSFPASGRTMSAEELSSEVLKALKEDVKRQTGEDITTAVITVPAAFGALQCEATSRAAQLAGIVESPLLQEPIAAAIAYGVTPGAIDQRWLVFDLGGGTLDIALVSTKDGRLNVLEHRGNNLLGGKDIDRIIIDTFFLPALTEEFVLPDPQDNPQGYDRLIRRLALRAEEAKIELSSAETVPVGLFDLGDDEEGNPIDLEVTISRKDYERSIEPLVEKCLQLCEEVLSSSRISGKDLDRVLLVGGPTQIPYVRSAIMERIGAKVDFSLDPMTVVAKGAAIYASTIEKAAKPAFQSVDPGKVSVQLAYEPVSASTTAHVAGRIENTQQANIAEIKIDADGGYWTSGWLPIPEGYFDIPVTLKEGKQSRFWLYARTKTGEMVDVEPEEFSIRHGLVVSSPPLPHSISVEVVGNNNKPELEVIFPKGTPLPAEKTCRYRAQRTLRPSEAGSALPIKLWEGEIVEDPEANEWVGNLTISSEAIRRPIPEGSEIEITIAIDASRRMTVDAFVPHLNQNFSDNVYVPQREEKDFADLLQNIPQEIESHLNRLDDLELSVEDAKAQDEIEKLREEIENLDIEASKTGKEVNDPDQAKRLVETSREIRGKLSKIERNFGTENSKTLKTEEAEELILSLQRIIEDLGSPLEKKEFEMLQRQAERSIDKGDERSLQKTVESLEGLKWKILFKQDWFWKDIFESMKGPWREFTNQQEAQKWIAQGDASIRRGDGEGLREAVRKLWELQPVSAAEADKERVLLAGLKRY